MPKKTPMIETASSPTETRKSSMPTGGLAACLRRLGESTSRTWVSLGPSVIDRGAFRGPRSGSARSLRKLRATSSDERLEDISLAMGAYTAVSSRKLEATSGFSGERARFCKGSAVPKEDAPIIPAVIRQAPSYPITLSIMAQFLTLAAPAASRVPPATGRVAPRSSESLRQHVAQSRL